MDYAVEKSFLDFKKSELALNAFNALIELEDRAHFLHMYEDGNLYPGLDSIWVEEVDNGKPSTSPQTVEKKKGLIARAWDTIVNLLTNVKNAVFKKNIENMGDPNRKVQVPKEIMEVPNETSKFNAALKKKKRGIFTAIVFVGIIIAGCAIIKRFKLFRKAAGSMEDNGGTKNDKNAKPPQQKGGMVTTDVAALKAMYIKMSKEFDEMQKSLLTNYKADELEHMDSNAMKMNSNDSGFGELQIQAKMLMDLKRELSAAGIDDIQVSENPNESARYSIVRSIVGRVGNSIRSMPSLVRGLGSVDPAK